MMPHGNFNFFVLSVEVMLFNKPGLVILGTFTSQCKLRKESLYNANLQTVIQKFIISDLKSGNFYKKD